MPSARHEGTARISLYATKRRQKRLTALLHSDAHHKKLEVLRSADYALTVQAIALPLAWLDAWEAALSQSEATLLEVSKARIEKHQHIGAGKNAEEAWPQTTG